MAVPQCRYLTYSHAFFVWYLSEPKEKRYGNEIDMGHCRALLALDSPSLQIKLFKEGTTYQGKTKSAYQNPLDFHFPF